MRRYLIASSAGLKLPLPENLDWYPIIQRAKYLNTTPWELAKQSVWWQQKAAIAMTAEHQAQKELEKRNTPK